RFGPLARVPVPFDQGDMMASVAQRASQKVRQGRVVAALTASLMLGACGQTLTSSGELLTGATQSPPTRVATQSGAPEPGGAHAPSPPSAGDAAELQRATDYWGKKYAENSRDLESALSYARNLKAMGEKRR